MAQNLFDLRGKAAVVIGGTSGIGRAMALALADAGANVAASSRRAGQVEGVAAEIEEKGRKSLRVACDVASRDSVENLCAASIAAFGKVDILINCAGKTERTATLDVSEEKWHDIMDTNLMGTLRGCQIFGRHMLERKYGRIINIASLASFVALYQVAAYCASKAAVASLTKSLAIEWASHGICVNAIAPGVVRTSLNSRLLDETSRGEEFLTRTPMQRFGSVQEIAGAAVFLASDAVSFMTGEIVTVDGGLLASGVNQ